MKKINFEKIFIINGTRYYYYNFKVLIRKNLYNCDFNAGWPDVGWCHLSMGLKSRGANYYEIRF